MVTIKLAGRRRTDEVQADLKTSVEKFKSQITGGMYYCIFLHHFLYRLLSLVVRLPAERIRLFLGEGILQNSFFRFFD